MKIIIAGIVIIFFSVFHAAETKQEQGTIPIGTVPAPTPEIMPTPHNLPLDCTDESGNTVRCDVSGDV